MESIKFFLETKVEKIVKQKNFVKVYTSGKEKKEFDCEVVLIAVGRKPNTKGLNLEENKIKLD